MTEAGLALEAATPDDLAALVSLENRCHTHPWTERGLFEAMAPAGGEGAILVLRGPSRHPAEERGIRAYCAYQVVAGEAHIHTLAVAPEARRQGLGKRLLALTLEIARRRGARIVHLEVRQGNAAARGLYRAMGFEEAGKRAAYYSSPVEDAILLVLTSWSTSPDLTRNREVTMSDEPGFKERLLKQNEEYRRLYQQHDEYESQLVRYSDKLVLSDEEQLEETTLKKKKLQTKDRMEAIARQARQSHAE